MKLSNTLTIVFTFVISLLSHAKATPYLPPEPISFPEYICIHEVFSPTNVGPRLKNRNPVTSKIYAYAYINPDMTCPPFVSAYEIPENEIYSTGDIIWEDPDFIWEDIAPIHCDVEVSDECASPMFTNANVACSDLEYCTVTDTNHDCRPGLLPAN